MDCKEIETKKGSKKKGAVRGRPCRAICYVKGKNENGRQERKERNKGREMEFGLLLEN